MRNYGTQKEWVAVPVTGECELINAEMMAAAGALIFVLRKTRTALLIDGIEKMATMTRLQALPLSFCREERRWYRNVYFAKRLGDALKREGFEVVSSTQAAFALTTLEYDAPSAIVCATNMREMGALEIAKIIHADPKNANLPIVALGDGSQRALMEAFQAGCDDYIDRNRQPAVIAAHVKQILVSKAEGFQPTQMLAQSDTSLSGNLTHHDLTGVMQMLGHAHQTGALHINAGETDGVLFYDAGAITHAECGNLFGDEAVIHILKSLGNTNEGVYKFTYGTASTQRTVLRSATDLMLDAMREFDEGTRDMADKEVQ